MSYFTTKDGTEIYYKDWGTGQPVVFCHGWPLCSDSWEPAMLHVASNGYRAVGQMDKAKATYDKAIALAFKVLRVNPRSADTMGSLALYFAKKGDMGQAMEFMKRARGSDPSSVDLILNAAEVHALCNRPEDAVADLEKGLKQGLTTTSIETDPELDSLRNRPDYHLLMTQYAPKKK